MKQKLYAFWKYDLFPFVLGGEITRMDNDGYVETVGYGPGFLFKPIKILPLEEGKRIAMLLTELKQEKMDAQAALDKMFLDKLGQIITIPE